PCGAGFLALHSTAANKTQFSHSQTLTPWANFAARFALRMTAEWSQILDGKSGIVPPLKRGSGIIGGPLSQRFRAGLISFALRATCAVPGGLDSLPHATHG